MKFLTRVVPPCSIIRSAPHLKSAASSGEWRPMCTFRSGGDADGGPHHDTASKIDKYGRAASSLQERSSPYRSLCKLTLIGRTGTAPDVSYFDDGARSLALSVATNHYQSGDRDRGVETQWHKVFVNGNTTGFEFLSRLAVGSQVYVEGNMRVRTVERDGQVRQYVNVMVSRGEGMVRVLHSPRLESQDLDADFKELPF